MSARDEVDGWAQEHDVSNPDIWNWVQPVYFGPESNPRGGGFQVWDDNGDLHWVEIDYEDYADMLDYMTAADLEGELIVVIEDEKAYA